MIGGAKNTLRKLKVMRPQVANTSRGIRGHVPLGNFEL